MTMTCLDLVADFNQGGGDPAMKAKKHHINILTSPQGTLDLAETANAADCANVPVQRAEVFDCTPCMPRLYRSRGCRSPMLLNAISGAEELYCREAPSAWTRPEARAGRYIFAPTA